jgi:GMP synthase-like glutamine amidotransferase
LLPHAETAQWFGPGDEAVVFQWHYDAFELPAGATLLASSDACPHQAFCVGPHMAMQFHVELDETKLVAWASGHDDRYFAAGTLPSVQTPEQMLGNASECLPLQQRMADRIYARWLRAAPD